MATRSADQKLAIRGVMKIFHDLLRDEAAMRLAAAGNVDAVRENVLPVLPAWVDASTILDPIITYCRLLVNVASDTSKTLTVIVEELGAGFESAFRELLVEALL